MMIAARFGVGAAADADSGPVCGPAVTTVTHAVAAAVTAATKIAIFAVRFRASKFIHLPHSRD